MATIPGGFADPATVVRLETFCLDVHEVTVEEYSSCVRRGACSTGCGTADWPGAAEAERAEESRLCNCAAKERGKHPVNCVEWAQAETYCRVSGKRLPTEEEWRWAAAGGSRRRTFPWGERPPGKEQACWRRRTGPAAVDAQGTCPVKSHPRGGSADGVHDLSGNVWEWTSTKHACGDGQECYVSLGGGWEDVDAVAVSTQIRRWAALSNRTAAQGFRCARDLPATSEPPTEPLLPAAPVDEPSDEDGLAAFEALLVEETGRAPTSALEASLVGIWQDMPAIASGWSDTFTFFPNGRVAHRHDQMDCAKRRIGRVGEWRVRGTTLTIRWLAELNAVGGRSVDSYASCGSDLALEDASLRLRLLKATETRMQLSKLQPGAELDQDGELAAPPSRVFGTVRRWKMRDDPFAYR